MVAGPLIWRRWREALRPCACWPSLRSTISVALVVGTVLFAINQLDVVLAGRAGGRVWLEVTLTFVVPFLVANYGLLVGASREHAAPSVGLAGHEEEAEWTR